MGHPKTLASFEEEEKPSERKGSYSKSEWTKRCGGAGGRRNKWQRHWGQGGATDLEKIGGKKVKKTGFQRLTCGRETGTMPGRGIGRRENF